MLSRLSSPRQRISLITLNRIMEQVILLYISFFPSNILLPSQVLVKQFDNVRRNIRALVLLAFVLEATNRYLSRSN